uniref:NADH-ubiquinone oxidoreductase chain 3 n=1 Tax=Ophiarachnella gorgonia TaxID=1365872 RepID=A0A6C0FGQ3_9ECHI|nr:NADH dehydrogenase subunit 3 [Ophiarachnella gorgonia]QHT54253.1 NADH dehydrogenase subunit 3 [Ophiarachnella gorgonia]
MSLLATFFIIVTSLTIIISILGQALPSRNNELEKIHPYECGFDPINSSRLPFSFRFFLIAILFLLFDLEIALLLPLPFSTLINNLNNSIIYLTMFLITLILGLYFEWTNGGLEWAES